MDIKEETFRLVINSEFDRGLALDAIETCPNKTIMTLMPAKASDELTSRLHCAIRCVAKQLEWGQRKWSEEEWKRMFVATSMGQHVVPSLDGNGLVVLDHSTGRMSGPTKSQLLEFVYSWGAERGVIFDDPLPEK